MKVKLLHIVDRGDKVDLTFLLFNREDKYWLTTIYKNWEIYKQVDKFEVYKYYDIIYNNEKEKIVSITEIKSVEDEKP